MNERNKKIYILHFTKMITEKADSFLFMSCKMLLYSANSGNLQTDRTGSFKIRKKKKSKLQKSVSLLFWKMKLKLFYFLKWLIKNRIL